LEPYNRKQVNVAFVVGVVTGACMAFTFFALYPAKQRLPAKLVQQGCTHCPEEIKPLKRVKPQEQLADIKGPK